MTKPRVLLGFLVFAACSRTTSGEVQRGAEPTSAEATSYRATGTEPFWGLAVTKHELRLTRPEPEPSVVTSYALEQRPDGRFYKGAAFTATVTFKPCSDGMSDRTYPHTVEVEFADRQLHGCGWPAGYDLGSAP